MEVAELLQQLADKDALVVRANEDKRQIESELEGVGRKAEAELSRVQSQVTTLQGELGGAKADAKAAREEAATARSEMAGAAAVADALKKDVETLKKQAAAREAAFRDKLAAELKRCDEEWARRAEARCKELTAELVEAHKQELADLSGRLVVEKESALAEQKERLDAFADEQKVRLEGVIADEQQRAADERARHAEELRDTVDTKEAEKEAIRAEAAEAAAAAAAEAAHRAEKAAEAHAAELSSLRNESAAAAAAVAEQHADEMTTERAARAAEVAECRRLHREEVEATVVEWTQKHAETEERLAEEKRQSLEGQEMQLRDEFDEQERLAAKKAQAEREMRDKRIESLEEVASTRAGRISELEVLSVQLGEELDAERAAHGAKSRELEETVERMAGEREASEEALRGEASSREAHLTRQHAATLELERSERAAEKEAADALQAETVAQLEDVTARFEARESRVEDLETIAMLEATIKAKDDEYSGLMAEAKNIRNEAMNREDTYNKNFKSGGAAGMSVASGGGMMEQFLAKKKAKAKGAVARRGSAF